MGFLIPMLASLVLLLGSAVLLSTVGRRRRARARPLEAGAVAAIEGALGVGLANLVAHALRLRQRIEDVAERGRELLAVERQLGGAPRRPLWRQIEDANFGHELAGLRHEAISFLARFDGLASSDRQIIEQLALDLAPVRRLVDDTPIHWGEASAMPPAPAPVRPRSQELHQLQAQLEPAAACLRQLELEISGYRGAAYR